MSCLVVFLVFASSVYAEEHGACLRDWASPEVIVRQDPTVVIEFGSPVDMDTLRTSFHYYPDGEGGRDFVSPVDKTDILSFKEEESNASVMRYALTEDLVDGEYYSVYVSAKVKEYEELTEGEMEEIGSVKLEECRLFHVDLGPLDISLEYPKGDYISDESLELRFETNRRATCYISTTTDTISRMNEMASTGESLEHRNVHPGSDYFYVACEDAASTTTQEMNLILDTEPPTTPEIDDSSPDDEHPDVFTSTSSIRVRFDSEDEISGVKLINYTIIDRESGQEAMAWSSTERVGSSFLVSRDDTGLPLSLEDGREYFFRAKALNNAGLWSELSESDGFKVDVDFDPDAPDNPCEEYGRECEIGEDCEEDDNCSSGFCHPEENVCAEPSCDDGFKNADQSDVDCGGSECPPCEEGQSCNVDDDCVTGYCDNFDNVCAEAPVEEPDFPDPVEEPEEESNFIMPIIVVVLALGILGGGGFYAYNNWSQISAALESFTGKSAPSQPSSQPSASSPKPQQSANNNTQKASENTTAKPSSNQIKDMGAKVSHRLKQKEKMRQRNNMFGSFSTASSEKTESKSDDDGLVSKKDIENLFGGVK